MPKRYTEPGKYLAICNKQNFDGHYAVLFEFPKSENEARRAGGHEEVDACWYFLNRVNFQACVEDVYPLEIFGEAAYELLVGTEESLVKNNDHYEELKRRIIEEGKRVAQEARYLNRFTCR